MSELEVAALDSAIQHYAGPDDDTVMVLESMRAELARTGGRTGGIVKRETGTDVVEYTVTHRSKMPAGFHVASVFLTESEFQIVKGESALLADGTISEAVRRRMQWPETPYGMRVAVQRAGLTIYQLLLRRDG